MTFPIRIDEDNKTDQQKNQRARTYAAAEALRSFGIRCEVREFFTGDSTTADAAGIFLHLEDQP